MPVFILQDNQDSIVTVTGVDSAGNDVDISGKVTIDAQSSDPADCGIEPIPSGSTSFTVHGLHPTQPGSVIITVKATWNDGSVGPFTIDLPVDIKGSVATGLTAVFGPPSVRP